MIPSSIFTTVALEGIFKCDCGYMLVRCDQSGESPYLRCANDECRNSTIKYELPTIVLRGRKP